MYYLSPTSNGREARNRAEKNRRDKLNGSIQELSTMVPHVAESPRRVDKTAVLRFSAHGLRVNYGEFEKKKTDSLSSNTYFDFFLLSSFREL
jgi:Helix-loop-helix DNA-binding domain